MFCLFVFAVGTTGTPFYLSCVVFKRPIYICGLKTGWAGCHSDLNTRWVILNSVSLYSLFLTDVFEFVFNKNAFKTLRKHVNVYGNSLAK